MKSVIKFLDDHTNLLMNQNDWREKFETENVHIRSRKDIVVIWTKFLQKDDTYSDTRDTNLNKKALSLMTGKIQI